MGLYLTCITCHRFLNRDLPYSALVRKPGDSIYAHCSRGPQTPSYVTVCSPPRGQSPGGVEQGAPSPNTQLVHKKFLRDRAQLLMDGREIELLREMSQNEQK